jgi:N-acetylglucosamine kinase-like BadF-type ATPase
VGEISGDEAGGRTLAEKVIREVYLSLYRAGGPTSMQKPVMDLLGVQKPEEYIETATELMWTSFDHLPYIRVVFEHAEQGDDSAQKILKNMARSLAQGTAGCLQNLKFTKEAPVEIILAGSVWVKPATTLLVDYYQEYLNQLTDLPYSCRRLKIPPGIGAALWALELAHGQSLEPDFRKKIITKMEAYY